MRRLFFVTLIVLSVAALLFTSIQQGAGYLLIAVGGFTIEMSFFVAILLNVMLFVALYFLVAGLRLLFSARSGVLGWAINQRRQRGLNRTTQGLIAFVEGRWDYARKSLVKAAGHSSTPLVNYLFAARASSAIGDAKAVDTYLKQAELSTEGAEVAIGLTQAELQINNAQYEQALATLLRAKRKASHHPVVLTLLAKVYRQLSDWKSLIKLLPGLRKCGAMTQEDLDALEREACCSMLAKSANDKSSDALSGCWRQLPNNMKKDPSVVACYCEWLIGFGLLAESERTLRHQLHREYDPQLMSLYGRSAGEKIDKQYAFAEKLLKSNPVDVHLLLALGRISLSDQRVGDAQDHFEKAIGLENNAEAFAELGKLYAEQGSYQKSAEHYARGLSLAQNGDCSRLPSGLVDGSANPELAMPRDGDPQVGKLPPTTSPFDSTDNIRPIEVR